MEGGSLSTVSIALAAGLTLHALAAAARRPPLLFLLVGGVALGPDGFGWVRPGELGSGFALLVKFGVAVVLFEGGLSLRPRQFAHAPRAIRNLVLVGLPITWLLATVLARAVTGLPWRIAGLFGVLVSVTGPTVIGPLLRRVRATPAVEAVLRWEAIWADCLGAVLTVVYFEYLVLETETFAGSLAALGRRLLLGCAVGAAVGWATGWVLVPRALRTLRHEGIPALLALAAAFFAFGVAESFESEAGVVSVSVAGFLVGSRELPGIADIREFKDRLTITFVSLLFILLSASVPLGEVREILPHGLPLVALLLLVVRPLAVAAGTSRSRLTIRERAFAAFIAPRGVVAASFAGYVAAVLVEKGEPHGGPLRALVFLTIAVSVGVASLLGSPLARLLGLAHARQPVAVLVAGSNRLAREIARWWRRRGGVVRLVDTDVEGAALASAEGLEIRLADPADPGELREGRDLGLNLLLAATESEVRNARIAEVATSVFPRARILVFGSSDGPAAAAARALAIRLVRMGASLGESLRELEEGSRRLEVRDRMEADEGGFLPLLAVTRSEWVPVEQARTPAIRIGLGEADTSRRGSSGAGAGHGPGPSRSAPLAREVRVTERPDAGATLDDGAGDPGSPLGSRGEGGAFPASRGSGVSSRPS